MKYQLHFQLDKPVLTVNYRRTVLSFIKKALTEYASGQYYDEFFHGSGSKPYCFAVCLPPAQVRNNQFDLQEPWIDVNFSSLDVKTSLILYNAFTGLKFRLLPLDDHNSMKLTRIRAAKETIVRQSCIIGKLSMPLCVRLHDPEQNKDQYFTFTDLGFEQQLKCIIEAQLKLRQGVDPNWIAGFSFAPVQMKKSFTKHYGQLIPGSLGIFRLCGQPELLNYLANEGMGSRRSAGFGTFDVIGQGEA
ncbi:hypothetical protein HCH52_05010 [Oscillospiraceae bacterium HV4-5-C5C]|nr:hypothetical protein [Oscillospiraceae bacterium HV4-5-C5C]